MQAEKGTRKPIGGYLQALMDACPDAVLAVASNGIILFANKMATVLLECEMKDLVGRSVVPFYESEERARAVSRGMYQNGGMIREFDSVCRTKNGKLVPVRISGSHLKDHAGAVTGSVGYFEAYRPWTEAEMKVRDYCKELESRVCTLTDINVPVFEMWPGISAVVMVGQLDCGSLTRIRESLMTHVMKVKSRVAVMDISRATIDGEETVAEFLKAARLIRLVGVQCFIAGIGLELARTLDELKADLTQIRTFSSLTAAFEAALVAVGLEIGPPSR